MTPILSLPLAAPALLYLDPGSGSLVAQAVIGGILGALLSLRMFGRGVLARVTRITRGRDDRDAS